MTAVYQDVFIQEMDRATSRLETVRINPTREFLYVDIDPVTGKWSGSPALYTHQNGQWFDTGRNPIPEDQVPQKFRDEIEANPVTVTNVKGPNVTAVCKFCKQEMNDSEMNQHLVQHVEQTLKAAGTTPAPAPAAETERPLTAKNTHRGG